MATDRLVTWRKNRKPTDDEILIVVEDFFNGAAVILPQSPNWLIVKFEGETKSPLERISPIFQKSPTPAKERWLEVHFNDVGLDVVSRLQDEYVNSLALGLIKVFQRYWNAAGDWEE